MMNWALMIIIFTVNFCVHDVIKAYAGNVITVIDDRKNVHTSDDRINDVTRGSTGSRDVRCTTIDDVIAIRRSLCPAQCRCSPLNGYEVLTKLTVDCFDAQFNQSTSLRLIQDLGQILSRCVSQLMELTITNTPISTVPQAVCQLSQIRALDLNSNKLASLPSNCFTRMLNLTSFRAYDNRLTSLQVRWRT